VCSHARPVPDAPLATAEQPWEDSRPDQVAATEASSTRCLVLINPNTQLNGHNANRSFRVACGWSFVLPVCLFLISFACTGGCVRNLHSQG
jgi:hypothetical protein